MFAFDAVVMLERASELSSLSVLARERVCGRLLCRDTGFDGGVDEPMRWDGATSCCGGAERLPFAPAAMRTAVEIKHRLAINYTRRLYSDGNTCKPAENFCVRLIN